MTGAGDPRRFVRATRRAPHFTFVLVFMGSDPPVTFVQLKRIGVALSIGLEMVNGLPAFRFVLIFIVNSSLVSALRRFIR